MRTPYAWLATAALAIVAASGCKNSGGGAYVPKPQKAVPGGAAPAGQEATLFPVAVGSQWTYESVTRNGINNRMTQAKTADVTYRCTEVHPTGTGVEAYFTVLTDGVVKEREIWRIDKTGIYQVAIGAKLNRFSEPLLILKFPVKLGETYEWKGSINADDGTTRTGSMKSTTSDIEQIDTDMGPYKAQPVDAEGKLDSPQQQSQIAQKIWFIPNVGIGRLLQEANSVVDVKNAKVKGQKALVQVSQVMKLKQYTPAK